MLDSLPSRRTTHAGRRPLAALLLAVAMASAPGARGAVPGEDGRPVAAELRLRALAQLAERSNPQARAALLQGASEFTIGVPYSVQVAYLRLLRRVHVDAGQLRDAYAVDERIIGLAGAEDDALQVALASLGRVHKRLNDNDPAAAMALLESLNTRYKELRSFEFEANAEVAYGAIYNTTGQHDRALAHYLRALELVQRYPALWGPREADVRLALARLYVNSGNEHKALDTMRAYREGREGRASRDAIPPRVEAAMYFMDGRAHVSLNQLAPAHAAFNRALALARKNELRWLEANVLGNVSDAWLKEQRYLDAERAARAAVAVAEDVKDQNAIQMAYANLGFALFGQGRMAEGAVYIDRTTAELRKADAMHAVSNILAEKSVALEKAGQYRQALQTVREREQVQETLSVERRNKAFAALQEQFNAKQRAAQIDRLRQENAVKDAELANRNLRFALASLGAALALALLGFVFMLYRKSQRTSRRLAELNAELAHRSAHDPLTGLFNRRSFVDLMQDRALRGQAVAPAVPAKSAAADGAGDCFTLLDIDHFKRINDQHGHAAGDAVLVEVGRRLNEVVRESDMVLRWGGEEFLVYSQGVTDAQRPLLVQRILNAIAAAPVVLEDGSVLQVRATAGAVSLPLASNEALGWEQAIALADRALYKGKEAGRNRGFIVEGVSPGVGAGEDRKLSLHLVLPDMYWQPAQ
ncbi:tetratricopeptide repeat-containing diguanylate cyclase [Massilia yuzhufengensis]|uniref:diguanylate cyclase n=1 Tax=Massilia yuzhufengensis TaxID=1164594 RepID=A0A1I1M402_9BURK|nr:tetratricopeptide repeat-containing diguanylate cyclase [Massilia yuzhufengensis]SFC80111.1 diguanylate cyclase (GGDEF) domain-containing protein [Massilia yuzhufengensis]